MPKPSGQKSRLQEAPPRAQAKMSAHGLTQTIRSKGLYVRGAASRAGKDVMTQSHNIKGLQNMTDLRRILCEI